jgi:hypothetical protein
MVIRQQPMSDEIRAFIAENYSVEDRAVPGHWLRVFQQSRVLRRALVPRGRLRVGLTGVPVGGSQPALPPFDRTPTSRSTERPPSGGLLLCTSS